MILIDAHVHIYSCFDLRFFFESAQKNFQAAARQVSGQEPFSPVLLLTDWSGKNWFQKLFDYADYTGSAGKLDGWRFHHTRERHSLYIEGPEGGGIYLIAGRKIISSENLEVLALTTDEMNISDGMPLIETVEAILSAHSVPMVPWAVGKWLGTRGEFLDRLIESVDPRRYFLCDNANRPYFWPRPEQFKTAEEKGGRILSGSDPLHFSSESGRSGRFGAYIDAEIDHDFPMNKLKTILQDPLIDIKLYGKLENSFRFLKNQISMQVFKRKWKTQYYTSKDTI